MKRRTFAQMCSFMGISLVANAQGPDFSNVDSREKVMELFKQGTLEKVFLFPLELGGKDIDANIVYLPRGLGVMKQQLDGTLVNFARDGLITKLTVEPVYKGKSFVPAKILIKASHPDRTGRFEPVLEVW